MEAVYDDIPELLGLTAFAPVVAARGPMFEAAARGGKQHGAAPVVEEKELYG